MSFHKFFGFKKSTVNQKLLDEYKELCIQAADLLASAGKKIKPFNDDSFARLMKHDDPRRVVENLGRWVQVFSEASESGESLLDDKKLLWRMLQKLELHPTSDLFDKLRDGETICIYTTDNWLIYFNLNFFDHIYATVDEVSTIVWHKDSKRDMRVTAEALRMIFLIKTKRLKNTFQVTTIPKHSVTYVFSNVPQKVEIELLFASPLFGKNGMSAYLVTQNTNRIY